MNKYIYISITITIFLSSCISKKQVLYMQDLNNEDINSVISSQHILQENDILNISVTSLELKASIPYNINLSVNNMPANIDLMKLNGYLVTKGKTINFPVLGEISVSGKTIHDLENYLKKRLETEGYLIKPNIIVRLINSKVTILGEVNQPGTFNFTENNISMLQALGFAGDLTIDGSREDVIVIREIDGKRVTTKLDLTSASLLNSPYQNILPNDVIIVNPNSKKVKSAGIVGNLTNVLSIASILLSTIILIR